MLSLAHSPFDEQVALAKGEEVALGVSSSESRNVAVGKGVLVSSSIRLNCLEKVVGSGVASESVVLALVVEDSLLELEVVVRSSRRALVEDVDIMIMKGM
jgi:hypothetical protein